MPDASAGRDELLNPSRRLPELRLPLASTGEERPLRPPGRRSPLLVLIHRSGCAGCSDFLARLAAERDSITEWDGHPLVIDPGPITPLPTRTPGAETFPVLVDAPGRLARALGVHPPALVIADQWGEIHALHEGGDAHRLPPPDEVVGWLRHLAMQCPECQGEAY